MFTDKQFNVVAKVDKYGRKMSKKDNYALQNYYQKGDESEDEEEGESDQSDSDMGSEEGEEEMNSSSQEQALPQEVDERDEVGKKFYDKDGNF